MVRDLKNIYMFDFVFRKYSSNYSVELNIPFTDKIMTFLYNKIIIRQTQEGIIEPIARKSLYRCTVLEIVDTYNSELRGICNYYAIASNYSGLHYFALILWNIAVLKH